MADKTSRFLGVGTVGLLAAGVLVAVAPASNAVFLGMSAGCNATSTGAAITASTAEGTAGNFIHTWTSGSGTFTPRQDMTVTYLVVGGGGGGGGSNSRTAGGGGGAGEYRSGTLAVTKGTEYSITVGTGGAGGTSGTSRGTGGLPANRSSIGAPASIVSDGGTGGAAGATNTSTANSTSGASTGGGGGASSGSVTSGTASAPGFKGANGTTANNMNNQNRAGGGGGGRATPTAPSAGTTGGAGGAGTTFSGNGLVYAAGGGGGGRSTAGTGGSSSVGGNGGDGDSVTTALQNGQDALANRGSGGGGAGNNNGNARTGGAGSAGVVVIVYPKNVNCPGRPTATDNTGPDRITWTIPTKPASQTIDQYTVVYRNSSRVGRDGWAIFARRTSLDWVADTTRSVRLDDCSLTGNGWTCGTLGDGWVPGQTYAFKVFARTDTDALGGMSTASVTYTVPLP